MHIRTQLTLFVICIVGNYSSAVFSWGEDGHSAIGILALQQIQTETRLELLSILGNLDDQSTIKACNWPDEVRETPEWEWSYPLHYINLPKGENRYSKARDCPDQLCATEAIKRYADILGDEQAGKTERQQAFAWLCHLTGDLHQPLHAGFAIDRGGNNFRIVFENEETNLHGFWDRTLINSRVGNWKGLLNVLAEYPVVEACNGWSPDAVDQWTEESHLLVVEEIYPRDQTISDSYADKSWLIMQQRMTTAASRLAELLNTILNSN